LVGLALDFSNADTALVADYKNGDEVWRSTAGSAWTLVNATKHTTDYDGTGPQTFTDGGRFSGTDELLIGPADSAHAWIAGGQGVMRTRNLTSSPSNWYPLQTGQEEVVVMDLATTPVSGDAELMSAVADNNGFYYPNVATRPNSRFTNPYIGNTTSLDFSEGNPDNWVRAWVNSDGVNGGGATSHDGGATWLVFGQAARLVLPPGQAAGWDEWDLKPYLAQHTDQVVTLVIIPSSSPSSTATLTYESRTGVNKPTLVINGTDCIASEDTYVNGLQTGSPVPNITNYGNETTLQTSYAYGMAQNAKWIYLKFDLTGVTSVSSATLRLYRTTAQTTAATCAVGVFGCADTGWTETGLTYANRPPTYASNHKAGATPVANYDYDPYWYTSIRPPVYATNGTTRALGGRVAISPVNPALIVWEPQYTTATMPLYYSQDRGVTWNTCLTTSGAIISSKILDRWTPRPSVKNLTVDRVNGTFYYTSGSAGGSVSLLSSTDGATWTVLPNFGTGIYAGLYQLQSAPPQSASATACDLWFAYEGGAWVRRAGSTSWTKLADVTAAQCLSFGKPSGATGYSTYIYGKAGGTLRGVYRLDNADAVTAPTPVFYGNPTTNEATALAGDRQSFGEVYFGTGGRGMFYYTP
ncbi:MAG TPA: DNRLRE domain-containing protein, partial [Rariglobus sp.]